MVRLRKKEFLQIIYCVCVYDEARNKYEIMANHMI
jgi:hypothetical protein